MFKKLLITTVLGVTLILNAEAAATENVRRTATKCEQGSHDSINYIKRHYKNCTQCREEVIPAGKCAKVKGKHKHYYCMCDSCDSGKGVSPSKAEAQKTEVAVAIKAEKVATKSSGSCKKQGSHTSIDWIKKRHKNCGNCGTQKGSKGETVYYCYCGDGCKNSSSSDLVAVPKKSLNLLKGSGEIVPKK